MTGVFRKIAGFLYSVWAYSVFFAVLMAGAAGYGLIAFFTSKKGRERRLLRVNNSIALLWGLLCGVRFSMERPPDLDPKGVYVFTPNHSSTLDMLIGSYAFRHGMRFLVKKELQKMPFLGFMFSRIGIFVDRGNPESRKASREVLRAWAQRGVSFCVFPEGTRNRTAEPLGQFYDGAFDAAISAGIPVAPIVFLGTRELMPMHGWMLRPGRLKAIYLQPVSTKGLGPESVGELRDRVYRMMHNAIILAEPGFSDHKLLAPDEPLSLPPRRGIT